MNGTHDPALVFAFYGVAVFASFAALDLGARIAVFDGARESLWLVAGAVALGSGVWGAHMVGMQSLRLPVEMSYDLGISVMSWMAAVAVSLLALYMISRERLTTLGIAVGAVVVGAGLGVVHYSGLWALRMTPPVSYDPLLLALSAVVAVAASALALFACFAARHLPGGRLAPAKIGAALVTGAVLCVTHYSSMAAARFAEGAACAADNLLRGGWMGMPLALATAGMLSAVSLLSVMDLRALMDRRRIEQRHAETERVRRLAYFDGATGLPNRSQFNERLLRQLISVGGRTPPPFALVYAELRGYRALLETMGQERLALVFKSLAGQLSRVLDEGDMLARLSHDSFVFLLREREGRGLEVAMAQAAAQFTAPVLCGGETLRLTWGIGFSQYPEHGNSTQQLVRAAMKLQREAGAAAKIAAEQIAVVGQGFSALPTHGP